jgi:inner membrane protein
VDSITHALVIAVVLALAGRPDLIPYGVAGAVLIDVDVAFTRFSDRDPWLYIFTHGGFTHSFLGAFLVALLSAVPTFLLSLTSLIAPFGVWALLAILAGAISHIALDYLAYPGIPLFYPLSDKKYTLGILGGPSALLMLASLIFVGAVIIGEARLDAPWPYVFFFALLLAFDAGAKLLMMEKTKGRTIATMSPLRWAVIEDTPEAYLFYQCDIRGRRTQAEAYVKYRGITPAEAWKNSGVPEGRRLRYHSYIVTVDADNSGITYHDPIREKGHIWYPPYYKTYHMPVMSTT